MRRPSVRRHFLRAPSLLIIVLFLCLNVSVGMRAIAVACSFWRRCRCRAKERCKILSLPRFIISLGIPHVGEETAYTLAKIFGNLENIKKAKLEELEKIQDIGPIVAESIYNWFRDEYNRDFLERLLKHLDIKEDKVLKKQLKLAGKKFVLTGSIDSMSREEAKLKIRELGGQIPTSVSKETDFVIAGDKPGSKYQKAKSLGIEILSEGEFIKKLKK